MYIKGAVFLFKLPNSNVHYVIMFARVLLSVLWAQCTPISTTEKKVFHLHFVQH